MPRKRFHLRPVDEYRSWDFDALDPLGGDCSICGVEGGYCAHSGSSPAYEFDPDERDDPSWKDPEDPEDQDDYPSRELSVEELRCRIATAAEDRKRRLRLKGTNLGSWEDLPTVGAA